MNTWDIDLIQFARLISELEAAGAFDENTLTTLELSMDLQTQDIIELVDRAQATWDCIKELTKG